MSSYAKDDRFGVVIHMEDVTGEPFVILRSGWLNLPRDPSWERMSIQAFLFRCSL